MKGKKNYDYNVVKADFIGKFPDGYAIGREVYLKKKKDDLQKHEKEEKKLLTEKELKIKLINQFRENKPELTIKEYAKMFSVSERTINRWFAGELEEIPRESGYDADKTTQLINIPTNQEIVVSEEDERKMEMIRIANS